MVVYTMNELQKRQMVAAKFSKIQKLPLDLKYRAQR
jgi:hypothetical protein